MEHAAAVLPNTTTITSPTPLPPPPHPHLPRRAQLKDDFPGCLAEKSSALRMNIKREEGRLGSRNLNAGFSRCHCVITLTSAGLRRAAEY